MIGSSEQGECIPVGGVPILRCCLVVGRVGAVASALMAARRGPIVPHVHARSRSMAMNLAGDMERRTNAQSSEDRCENGLVGVSSSFHNLEGPS